VEFALMLPPSVNGKGDFDGIGERVLTP
jgi:hypothetical protein